MARTTRRLVAPSGGLLAGEVSQEGVTDVDETGEVLEARSPIASYGADYPVDGLVKRLIDGSITIPTFDPATDAGGTKGFQRKYVWTFRQADRFIESLLL